MAQRNVFDEVALFDAFACNEMSRAKACFGKKGKMPNDGGIKIENSDSCKKRVSYRYCQRRKYKSSIYMPARVAVFISRMHVYPYERRGVEEWWMGRDTGASCAPVIFLALNWVRETVRSTNKTCKDEHHQSERHCGICQNACIKGNSNSFYSQCTFEMFHLILGWFLLELFSE